MRVPKIPKTPPRSAPGQLGILHALIHSAVPAADLQLDSPEAMTSWLQGHHLHRDAPLDEDAWRDALQLRDDLRALLRVNSGGECPPEVLERLNDPPERRYRHRFTAGGTFRQTLLYPTGWPGVRLHLLEIVRTAMADGTWRLFRFCDSKLCPWTFYDTSSNHRGRWCRPGCGNLEAKRKSRRRRRR